MDLLTCSQTMSRHEGSVTCLTMCQGRIISGSVDSTIKVLITSHIPHFTTHLSFLCLVVAIKMSICSAIQFQFQF